MNEEYSETERWERELRRRVRETEFRLDPDKRALLYRELSERPGRGLRFWRGIAAPLCLVFVVGLLVWQVRTTPEKLSEVVPAPDRQVRTDPLLSWEGDRTIDRVLRRTEQRIQRTFPSKSRFETSPLTPESEIRNRIRSLQAELI